MMCAIFNKLFTGGEWRTAYRRRTDSDKAFQIVQSSNEFWTADPFCVEDNGEHYIFCEVYQKQVERGSIGYYHIIDGKPIYQGTVIQNSYHMSYPCIFVYCGNFYMIPETSANQSIELYRAERFPDQWVLDKVLLKGARYVDSTVYQQDGEYYLLSYQKQSSGFSLTLFSLNMDKKQLAKVGEKVYSKNIGRPAGSLFCEEGALLRPAQNCSKKYGEGLYFYKVAQLNAGGGIEEDHMKYISIAQIPVEGKFQRLHTYNRDSIYEVVDLFQEKFDLFHALKILRRRSSAGS